MVVDGAGEEFIFQHRLFRSRHLVVVGITLVLLLVACEPVGECSLRLLWLVVNDGPVGLVYVQGKRALIYVASLLK